MVNFCRKRVKCEYFVKVSKILPDKTKEIEAEIKNLKPQYNIKLRQKEFSKREFEILKCLLKGMNNTEISDELFISISTVKAHVSSILQKLGASDRTEAIHITKQKKAVLFCQSKNLIC